MEIIFYICPQNAYEKSALANVGVSVCVARFLAQWSCFSEAWFQVRSALLGGTTLHLPSHHPAPSSIHIAALLSRRQDCTIRAYFGPAQCSFLRELRKKLDTVPPKIPGVSGLESDTSSQ
jgi:hypothetical protein